MITAAAVVLACPRCGCELPLEALQAQGAVCPTCAAHVEGAVFPALFRADATSVCEPVVSGEAACFFHPDRVAAVTCSRCGRFLCALCRISWAGENVCTACLEPANRATQTLTIASSRFHYDSMALALSTLPVLTWIFSLFTAPLALGFALFAWRRECSIVPRSKIRFVAAILFSALTIASWILFWVYLTRRSLHPSSSPTG